jgi:polyisoprenoid-binding protein YceI
LEDTIMSTTELSAAPLSNTISDGTYNIDPAHSHVGFSVKHMGISTVRGSFDEFEGAVTVAGSELTAGGHAKVASITTGADGRDEHLRSADFFDSEQHPKISFNATGLEGDSDDIKLSGDITIKGITKPVVFKGEVSNGGQDPWGNDRVGFELDTKIDRRDFGLTWNQTLANNGVLVSNDVKLSLSISAVKAA